MTGYTKLFGSIVASTIWREDDKTRIVWITMLAIANKHGEVEASVPGLADLSRVTVPEARAAIAKLEAPDPDSRSTEEEGRRIVKIPGGWRLVNHGKYRAKLSVDERREYLAQKQRECRARQQSSTNVNSCQLESKMSTPSTQAEAEAEADSKAEASKKIAHNVQANPQVEPFDGSAAKRRSFTKPTDDECRIHGEKIGLPKNEVDKFLAFYESKGWKVGREPMKSWKSAMAGWKIRWEENGKPGSLGLQFNSNGPAPRQDSNGTPVNQLRKPSLNEARAKARDFPNDLTEDERMVIIRNGYTVPGGYRNDAEMKAAAAYSS